MKEARSEMEIKIKGRLISPIVNKNTNEIRLARRGDEAEIILSPPTKEELEKLKEGPPSKRGFVLQ